MRLSEMRLLSVDILIPSSQHQVEMHSKYIYSVERSSVFLAVETCVLRMEDNEVAVVNKGSLFRIISLNIFHHSQVPSAKISSVLSLHDKASYQMLLPL